MTHFASPPAWGPLYNTFTGEKTLAKSENSGKREFYHRLVLSCLVLYKTPGMAIDVQSVMHHIG